mgnify:CR=1 FL=1|tara:strand:- start:77 stop:298 length:222 start_codon:yes stop_codon:yes gene_type:complete
MPLNIDKGIVMGEVIQFPLKHLTFRIYDKKEELLFAQRLRCPECNKLKEDDWFITYKDDTYICVDCSYEQGEK